MSSSTRHAGTRQRNTAAAAASSSSSTTQDTTGSSPSSSSTPSAGVASKPSSSGQGFAGRCLRRCGWFLVYAFIIVITPMVMNHAALSKEQKALMPTPGSLVRINKHQRLFLRCLGHGSPVVVLEAPMGQTHSVFEKLQMSLAKHTRVCSYDRAGLGFSERPFVNRSDPAMQSRKQGMPHTVEHMAEDLYKLLVVESGLPPPYVLVGVELGALISRFFAQIFEGAVGAVVLVDPLVEGVENFEQGAIRRHWRDTRLFPWQAQQLAAATGLYRLALLTGTAANVEFDGLTERQVDRKKHLMCQPAHWQSAVEELFLVNETSAQIQLLWRIKSFPSNISVSMVTGDPDSSLSDPINKAWQQSHSHLLDKLHPTCKHTRVPAVRGQDLVDKRSAKLHEVILKAVDSVKEAVAAAAPATDAQGVPAASPASESAQNVGDIPLNLTPDMPPTVPPFKL